MPCEITAVDDEMGTDSQCREQIQDPKTKEPNLPWVEKYRPSSFADLVSHGEILNTLKKFIEDKTLPHLLFYGPPGTGKTSTILTCARQLYGSGHFNSMVLELNASDDRGIGIVRGRILSFASTRTIFSQGFKLVILDEADAMTHDAQNALRRIIEKYTENVRFCLICNYLTKIIPALQSRCTRFRFGPLKKEEILPRLDYVIEKEGLHVEQDGKEALIHLSQGDMRKVLNILQSASMTFDVLNEENIYTSVGHPLRSDIRHILFWLMHLQFHETFDNMKEIKKSKGLALVDILEELHEVMNQTDLPNETLASLNVQLSEIEYRLAGGSSEDIQLGALLAAFYEIRVDADKFKLPSA